MRPDIQTATLHLTSRGWLARYVLYFHGKRRFRSRVTSYKIRGGRSGTEAGSPSYCRFVDNPTITPPYRCATAPEMFHRRNQVAQYRAESLYWRLHS
jgi:hypothetical protein